MGTFGIPQSIWAAAKREAKVALAARARVRGMMPYSELVQEIRSLALAPHDPRLFSLLADLSTEEFHAGRGMISSLVVHKTGDMQPGPGFFDLARELGLDTTDILNCWIGQVKKVHSCWSNHAN